MFLTKTQVKSIKKSIQEKKGKDLKNLKTQMKKAVPKGGSLFSSLFSFARL